VARARKKFQGRRILSQLVGHRSRRLQLYDARRPSVSSGGWHLALCSIVFTCHLPFSLWECGTFI
jgi:hypothetical protein